MKQTIETVRISNLNLILKRIIEHEPVSRANLVRLTGISKPAVSDLVADLIDKGLVTEIGEGESKIGRKPILLKFCSTNRYFFIVEIGRAHYVVALSDLKGEILQEITRDFEASSNYRERLFDIKKIIERLIKESRIDWDQILELICITPTYYIDRGTDVRWNPDFEYNEIHDIKSFFKKFFKMDIAINHSTKMALLGEKIAGRAKNYNNVIYIDFAYGLGCAIMTDGKIHFGHNYTAGEMGYSYSSIDEFKNYKFSPFGLGALEEHVSGKAVREKALEAVQKKKDTMILRLANGNVNNISARIVFEAAIQHDPIAYSILRESFNYFNMALSNIINFFSPELVILGGGFAKSKDFLLSLIRDDVADKVLMMPRMEVSELEEKGSIIGAIHYLISKTDYLSCIQTDRKGATKP